MSGYILVDGIRNAIEEDGLIDTRTMIDDVQPVRAGNNEIHVGTSLDDPNYPYFLNYGFRHYQSNELVGPYLFFEGGVAASEDELRRAWGTI